MVPTVRGMARDFDAEAVCVLSNPHLTKKIVYELRAQRAYRPLGPSLTLDRTRLLGIVINKSHTSSREVH